MARCDSLGPVRLRTAMGFRGFRMLTSSKYAWFGAMRNPAWLYGVSPSNLLMNPDGGLTDL